MDVTKIKQKKTWWKPPLVVKTHRSRPSRMALALALQTSSISNSSGPPLPSLLSESVSPSSWRFLAMATQRSHRPWKSAMRKDLVSKTWKNDPLISDSRWSPGGFWPILIWIPVGDGCNPTISHPFMVYSRWLVGLPPHPPEKMIPFWRRWCGGLWAIQKTQGKITISPDCHRPWELKWHLWTANSMKKE